MFEDHDFRFKNKFLEEPAKKSLYEENPHNEFIVDGISGGVPSKEDWDNLQPGDMVLLKPKEEIEGTLGWRKDCLKSCGTWVTILKYAGESSYFGKMYNATGQFLEHKMAVYPSCVSLIWKNPENKAENLQEENSVSKLERID